MPLATPVTPPATDELDTQQFQKLATDPTTPPQDHFFQPKTTSESPFANSDPSHLSKAQQILDIIHRYKPTTRPGSYDPTVDGVKFLSQICAMLAANQHISMCLPAFPFKSPNRRAKVLGTLPDMAEAFALANLNGMCAAIKDVYPPGATLCIISDGLVYNDLLGVPDRDVWDYGEALRNMSAAAGLHHIEFSRLQDLMPHNVNLPAHVDEKAYVDNAAAIRSEFLDAYNDDLYDASLGISQSDDTCMTYRGYIRFLQTDLEHVLPLSDTRSKSQYKKEIEQTAKKMLHRGDAFARAIKTKFGGDCIRLSIHPSTGSTKIPVSPLPTDGIYTTLWHCTIAFRLDGTVSTAPRSTFEGDATLELVQDAQGVPSYFCEKTDLLSWGGNKGGIVAEPIYPSGWLICPATPGAMDISDIDAAKVRALSELNSPVVLRGFSGTTSRDALVAKAHEFGKPLPWKFGLVLEVKDRGADARGLNNVLSAERMPFHFDGLFKTEKQYSQETGEEELVPVPPHFQLFAAVTPSPPDTGYTVFSTSRLIFRHLADKGLSVEQMRGMRWSARTSAFDASVIRNLQLVVDHPSSGRPCLRYHEPWPSSRTVFDQTIIELQGGDISTGSSSEICAKIDSVLHDRRVAYYHSWEEGDLLVSDNILNMHTRSEFVAGCDRELWRIHFD
ncbi:hypothetical protein MCOR22_004279 [Pyricularia oryzae]|nr:hypothetical protein MCOR22_004279 [Pyricularia oryzae]